jgi:hypothetical protein
MTTATAKIIKDSICNGIRLTTIQLRYPRMVHADFMTHRLFSRNGRSSRAVPFSVLVKEEPYVPFFMKNQPGMVATEGMSIVERKAAEMIWLEAAKHCQMAAQKLADLKVHKQWVNRMLEWFGYIDVLVTSTEWNNFFALRDEMGAQPEIQDIAVAIKKAMTESNPQILNPGVWHLPYIEEEDHFNYDTETLKKISVARCARLTIKPFDGDGSIEKELKRYSLLMESRPVHASPAEHIATPDVWLNVDTYHETGKWKYEHEHGNFTGWRQFRKQIEHNTVW